MGFDGGKAPHGHGKCHHGCLCLLADVGIRVRQQLDRGRKRVLAQGHGTPRLKFDKGGEVPQRFPQDLRVLHGKCGRNIIRDVLQGVAVRGKRLQARFGRLAHDRVLFLEPSEQVGADELGVAGKVGSQRFCHGLARHRCRRGAVNIGVLGQDHLEFTHQRRVRVSLCGIQAHSLRGGVPHHLQGRFSHVPLLAPEAIPERDCICVGIHLYLGLLQARHDVGRLGKFVRVLIRLTTVVYVHIDIHHFYVAIGVPASPGPLAVAWRIRPTRHMGRCQLPQPLLHRLCVHLLVTLTRRRISVICITQHLFLHCVWQLVEKLGPHHALDPL